MILVGIIKSQNCLLRGNSLLIGESLISNNGIYNITVTSRGNVCLFDNISRRWCSGFISPSAWKMVLTVIGNFAVIKTNGITIWAPNYPVTSFMTNIEYAIISNNGNFIIHNSGGLIWSCYRGTFSRFINASCPITSETENIGDTCNNVPTASPTISPSANPTNKPTANPTSAPKKLRSPTYYPTTFPTPLPTLSS